MLSLLEILKGRVYSSTVKFMVEVMACTLVTLGSISSAPRHNSLRTEASFRVAPSSSKTALLIVAVVMESRELQAGRIKDRMTSSPGHGAVSGLVVVGWMWLWFLARAN